MTADVKSIVVNGIEYVSKDCIEQKAESLEGMKYVIVRCDRSGVFAGYLKSREGREVVILKARRLHYWNGAASLSQAAMEGFSKPQDCRFPQEVDEVLVLDAIEILPCTLKAQKSIKGVKVWQA